MVLSFLSRALRPDLHSRSSPPAYSPSPTSQLGGSSNGARAGVARNSKELEHMLANLEKEGVEIDGKIASIIDDEVAKIKAEAVREKINERKRNEMTVLQAIACVAVGFIMGVEWYEYALRAAIKTIIFG
ncbi:hypothetical protein EJB05_22717 [Eragrostis curvula]|uniref:Uncharacterized protein n=1 Tax=Eragrostis curvula TaxID=38414 RepID=A0A5J9V4D9_9POAL|nr:hypothetical protein EJB05_22717 [Eragrostis curvula]